jgi:hypothetical protein
MPTIDTMLRSWTVFRTVATVNYFPVTSNGGTNSIVLYSSFVMKTPGKLEAAPGSANIIQRIKSSSLDLSPSTPSHCPLSKYTLAFYIGVVAPKYPQWDPSGSTPAPVILSVYFADPDDGSSLQELLPPQPPCTYSTNSSGQKDLMESCPIVGAGSLNNINYKDLKVDFVAPADRWNGKTELDLVIDLKFNPTVGSPAAINVLVDHVTLTLN